MLLASSQDKAPVRVVTAATRFPRLIVVAMRAERRSRRHEAAEMALTSV
jgi:hypothetical protein